MPGGDKVLRDALKGGAVSIGEMKFNVALDSADMRRVYDIAAEMKAPVTMHIQTFPHSPGEMPYNTGYPQFDKVLRAYPRTMFIGHGRPLLGPHQRRCPDRSRLSGRANQAWRSY